MGGGAHKLYEYKLRQGTDENDALACLSWLLLEVNTAGAMILSGSIIATILAVTFYSSTDDNAGEL